MENGQIIWKQTISTSANEEAANLSVILWSLLYISITFLNREVDDLSVYLKMTSFFRNIKFES